jgi:hypothetical protein
MVLEQGSAIWKGNYFVPDTGITKLPEVKQPENEPLVH